MRREIPILICLALLMAGGCARRAVVRRYYVLEVSQEKERRVPRFAKTVPFRAEVRDFRIAKAFDQTRIAVRFESHTIDYYFYHFWAVRPSVAVADVLYRALERTHFFEQIGRESSLMSTYRITGEITALERVERGKASYAHVAGAYDLILIESDTRVLRHEFDQTLPLLKDRTMNRFVSLVAEILYQEGEAFSRRLADYFGIELLPVE